MARAILKGVNPVLPSQDVKISVDFYVKKLAFKNHGQDSRVDPKYAVVGRDNVDIHIQWHDPVEWEAEERPHIRFVVTSIQDLFDEYKDKGVFHETTTLRDTPWGTREFAFFDPYSNGLTFYCDT
jgi:catechol 2,3-dioxygenase-like lactoylglutathione lyase family enzyme